jgi:hypothetical protein
MDEIDVWRAAHLVMKDHGDDAGFVAAMRADALLANGDTAGCSWWIKISRAIKELRLKPRDGEALN